MEPVDTIFIRGLEFYAYHGFPDAEQETGHRYRVDLRLTVDLRAAGVSDDVADTVDYARITDLVLQIGTREQFRLLEALATRIATEILTQFLQIDAVHLRIWKPFPPMNAIVEEAGVEITRFRI